MNKKICVFIGIVLFVLIYVGSSEVYADAGRCKLNGGVGNYGKNRRYYYIDSSCNTGGVSDKIKAAWSDWINTTTITPISTRQTTTKSQSVFDFYLDYSGEYGKSREEDESGLDAWTEYYINPSTRITPSIEVGNGVGNEYNWDWTNVKINGYRYFDLSESFDIQKAVIAHEIGHAMGLVHSSDSSNSIMRRKTEYINVEKCTTKDLEDIKKMYGGN